MPRPPTRLEEWYDHPEHRVALLRLIQTEPLKTALDILVLEGLPRSRAVAPEDINANAMLNTRREGFYEFFHALNALTELPPESLKTAPLEPWQHKAKVKPPVTT